MSLPEIESLRERKKRLTRQAISDAAMALFVERGFDAVTVTEVAAAADVSEKTVFNHFSCKEELLFDLDPDIEAALIDLVKQRAPGVSVLEALRHFAGSVATAEQVAEPNPPGRAIANLDEQHVRSRFHQIILESPTLLAYQNVRAARYEAKLRDAFLAEIAADDVPGRAQAYALAAAVIAIIRLEFETGLSPSAKEGARARPLLDAGFDALERGFAGWQKR